MAKLSDLALTSTDPNSYIDEPTALERFGRGIADLTEPVQSAYYGLTDSAKQKAFDAQRTTDEAIYLEGLLGTAIPAQLRPAVPDIYRSLGQAAPFLALGPLGGLTSLTPAALTGAAASTIGYGVLSQPLMNSPAIYRYLTNSEPPGQ